jgi:hypothetical protein
MTSARRKTAVNTAGRAGASASRGKGAAASEARPERRDQGAHIVPDRIWVVLARRFYEEPLREVGTVEADDRELACVYARSIYDEFAWIEMAVVPRDALITVIAS